ncbi:hypothetical protein FACS1894163_03950 [Spirochaetia bacterium]|nr:hypothetical protein FACS1894163_03950 [Spirochaetia bacterium]
MIKKWGVKDFKSIKDAELELAPLTIFAGANSSGKSSFLQSILLIAQSISSNDDSPIVLFDKYVKFPKFSDALNEYSENKNIGISFHVKNKNNVEYNIIFKEKPAGSGDPDDTYYLYETEKTKISMQIHGRKINTENLKHSKDIEKDFINTTLEDYNQSIKTDLSDGIEKSSIDKETAKYIEEQVNNFWKTKEANVFDYYEIDFIHPNISYKRLFPDALSYSAVTKESSLRKLFDLLSLVPITPVSIEESKMLVKNLLEKERVLLSIFDTRNQYNYFTEILNWSRWGVDNLSNVRSIMELNDILLGNFSSTVSGHLLGILSKITNKDYRQFKDGLFLSDWFYLISSLDSDAIKELKAKLLGNDSIHDLYSKCKETYTFTQKTDLPNFREAANEMADFFSKSLNYIGPLRESPKLFSLLASLPKNVGISGEYSSFMHYKYANYRIWNIIPEYLEATIAGEHIDDEEFQLEDAVNIWLEYIGIAKSIRSVSYENLGFGWKITPLATENKSCERDLTNMGVGVSQVIPIIVGCLLAKPQDTIIIEQPELHLHPKMQSKLVDFFIAMALSGRQILIETHSEHFIERMRCLVAKAPRDNPVNTKVKLYFSEEQNGKSIFRDIAIDEYANFSEWPEGFFDESQNTVVDIMNAVARKIDGAGLNE